MITHHPCNETIVTHAAGSLAPGLSLVTAAHLEVCPRCYKKMKQAEEIGGGLLESLSPEKMSSDCFPSCMARIGRQTEIAEASREQTQGDNVNSSLPNVLASMLDENLDALNWQKLVQGIWEYRLPVETPEGGWTRLFRFAPGARVPIHGHSGVEMSLVLQGSYSDHSGKFGAGDCAENDQHTSHSPVVDSEEDCIALIAVTGRIHFQERFFQLAGRLIGL